MASTYIVNKPSDNDVLFGRGGRINEHPGNKKFRAIVKTYKNHYNNQRSKREKRKIIDEVIDRIKNMGGNFLEKGPSGNYIEQKREKAFKKTSQALREGAPKKRRINAKQTVQSACTVHKMESRRACESNFLDKKKFVRRADTADLFLKAFPQVNATENTLELNVFGLDIVDDKNIPSISSMVTPNQSDVESDSEVPSSESDSEAPSSESDSEAPSSESDSEAPSLTARKASFRRMHSLICSELDSDDSYLTAEAVDPFDQEALYFVDRNTLKDTQSLSEFVSETEAVDELRGIFDV